MEIKRNYEYRTDYSKTTYGAEQTMNIEDNLIPEIIHAETMLLGVRVRYLVDVEVFEAGDFQTDDYMVHELTALRNALMNAVSLIRSVCHEADCVDREPYNYARFREFMGEAKIINKFIQTALAEVTPPTVQTV